MTPTEDGHNEHPLLSEIARLLRSHYFLLAYVAVVVSVILIVILIGN